MSCVRCYRPYWIYNNNNRRLLLLLLSRNLYYIFWLAVNYWTMSQSLTSCVSFPFDAIWRIWLETGWRPRFMFWMKIFRLLRCFKFLNLLNDFRWRRIWASLTLKITNEIWAKRYPSKIIWWKYFAVKDWEDKEL